MFVWIYRLEVSRSWRDLEGENLFFVFQTWGGRQSNKQYKYYFGLIEVYHTVNNIFICFIVTEWATEAEIPGNS